MFKLLHLSRITSILGILLFLLFANHSFAQPGGKEKVVRVGYQKSGAFLLVRTEGSLEKKLAPLGYRVEWKEFTAGPRIIEALNAGSVDIGHSGDCPVILAQAAGVPLQYIGCTKADPDSAAIIVAKNSLLQKITDLKGKKIAFDRGTSGHYLVARALKSVGLSLSDISPVYLSPPDARAAFQSGAVDAWSIWDPFFAAAEVDAAAQVLVSTKEFSPHREFYFGRKDYLKKNPEIIGALFSVLNETGARASQDPKATAAFLSEKLGIKLEVMTRTQLRNTRYNALELTEQVIAEQQEIADFLFDQAIISKPVKIVDAVYHPINVVVKTGKTP